MQNFEKMGVFYLGREFDLTNQRPGDNLLLYDSKDLTTHAVVVGMTGSGKTGLCIDLLEEAGLDRIPSIVIDPKGDIANLLLTFPNLKPEDFRPWVDESQATREGITADELAVREAAKWSRGLADWGQSGDRIRQLRDSVNIRVYTPGSDAGRPLTVLKSFDAPSKQVRQDSDAFRERISSVTSGLLTLLGIDADPIRSREHILISTILDRAWKDGQHLDLGQLIASIQAPPFERVGVMHLDTFFPAKERLDLAMTLNNLLASPSFAAWMSGESLDVKRLLHTPEGQPCISILSIAHLNDQERMFFVTILLNEIVTWMRTQSGTSSLRALLYMDEVFGYFPPTAIPPSKPPMLTLLKQARAYGLGIVLATQNPVDLDYKGLSNTGTWFLGRLQTERDKIRVLQGLQGAAAQTGTKFDQARMEQVLSGLGKRQFLMNNVHEDDHVIFETRWAMSYLRGPLTRRQIQQLVAQEDPADKQESAQTPPADARRSDKAVAADMEGEDPRLLIPANVEQKFAEAKRVSDQELNLIYRPALMARARLHYVRASYRVDYWTEKFFLSEVAGQELPSEIWPDSEVDMDQFQWSSSADPNARFEQTPEALYQSKNYRIWEKELKEFLYRQYHLEIWKCVPLKEYSQPVETLGDFKVRLEQKVSEHRDAQMEKLRNKYASRFRTARDRVRRAEERVDREEQQYQASRTTSMVKIAETVMGALLGRRTSRSASSSVRSYGEATRQKADVRRATENWADAISAYEELEVEFDAAIAELRDKLRVDQVEFQSLTVAPRKSDILIEDFGIGWLPWTQDARGIVQAAF